MRLPSPWEPRLAPEPGAPSERLAAALASDIIEGRLGSGARLPAHRDLAWRLGIGVGTVTKAYAVLERRGLVRSARGSGTFVAVAEARRGPLIDLSQNVPPAVLRERLLSRTLSTIARRVDPGLFNAYPPIGGHDEHRRQMARWLAGLGIAADPARLLLTVGAQHAIAIAFSAACGRDGAVYAEAQTYAGAIALARHQGLSLTGLAMDAEGLLPEALDRALARHAGGQAAVYVMPTQQNPTTSTMTLIRREAIVAICRARDAVIVEDDVYTLAATPELPALVTLAPERTLYVNGLSKTVNPALRIGALLLPEGLRARAEAVLRATALLVSSMSCAVMQQWLLDGTAEAVRRAIQDEARRRNALARSLLGAAIAPARQDGHHVWLPMPQPAAERLETVARALGVVVTPPASTAAAPEMAEAGIRLCIGAPPMAALTTGLAAIAGILAQRGEGASLPAAAIG